MLERRQAGLVINTLTSTTPHLPPTKMLKHPLYIQGSGLQGSVPGYGDQPRACQKFCQAREQTHERSYTNAHF